MLKVENISKSFGDFQAIDSLSFEVKIGDVMGFLGPNGAGKTTSMRVITGYLKTDVGSIYVDNKNFEASLHNYYSAANSQIPNDQKGFMDFCYGDLAKK